MNTRNPKLLLICILSFIFCLHDRLADSCLIEHSNGDADAFEILVKVFELFNKIPRPAPNGPPEAEPIGLPEAGSSVPMEAAPIGPPEQPLQQPMEETDIFKRDVETALQPEKERMKERAKIENKLNIYDFAVLIVKGLAFQNAITFIAGYEKHKQSAPDRASNCAYVAMYLAAFVLPPTDDEYTEDHDIFFKRLFHTVEEVAKDLPDPSTKLLEELNSLWDEDYQRRLIGLRYTYRNLAARGDRVILENPKMEKLNFNQETRFCKVFGEALYGEKKGVVEGVENEKKWEMAQELRAKIRNGHEENLLTKILRKVEIPETEDMVLHGLTSEVSLRVVVLKSLVCLFSVKISKEFGGVILPPYGADENPTKEYLPIDEKVV